MPYTVQHLPAPAPYTSDPVEIATAERAIVPIKGVRVSEIASCGVIPVVWLNCRKRPDVAALLHGQFGDAGPPITAQAWYHRVRIPGNSRSLFSVVWQGDVHCALAFPWNWQLSMLHAIQRAGWIGLTIYPGYRRSVLCLPTAVDGLMAALAYQADVPIG